MKIVLTKDQYEYFSKNMPAFNAAAYEVVDTFLKNEADSYIGGKPNQSEPVGLMNYYEGKKGER